jgi:SAM-dependent methyltransferase
MDLSTFDLLLSAIGRAALAAAGELRPTEAKYPACFDRLRKHYSPELARAALDTVLLREKARTKFARAGEMFFTRESLEMASAEPVARHRAGRFAPFTTVADLCCGIGGDALGLAAAGRAVVAVDRNPLLVRMAEANLIANGLTGRFICSDVLSADLSDCGAAFADPGRRPGGRRTLSLHECEPPLPALVGRFPRAFPLAVKVAPGFPKGELAGFDAEPEFVSLGGELKECVLWFGPLRAGEVRATVLPGPHTLAGDPDAAVEVGPIGRYLHDPDPAVTRAGLVGELARRLGARLIDPMIAFLTSDDLIPSPFASAYRVEEVLPFQARRVGEWLKGRGVGRVTVVKRGSAVDADELVSRWKLRGDGYRAVILTRVSGRPVAVIGERLEMEPGGPNGPPVVVG